MHTGSLLAMPAHAPGAAFLAAAAQHAAAPFAAGALPLLLAEVFAPLGAAVLGAVSAVVVTVAVVLAAAMLAAFWAGVVASRGAAAAFFVVLLLVVGAAFAALPAVVFAVVLLVPTVPFVPSSSPTVNWTAQRGWAFAGER